MFRNLNVDQAVLLAIGLVIVVSVVLALYVNLNWIWLTGLMGLHLIQLAFTGFCPLGKLLESQGMRRGAAI
jgi:hypothetical protein